MASSGTEGIDTKLLISAVLTFLLITALVLVACRQVALMYRSGPVRMCMFVQDLPHIVPNMCVCVCHKQSGESGPTTTCSTCNVKQPLQY